MKRDIALVLLGAWLMGIIAMAGVAMQNFYTIDRLLESSPNPAFARGVDALEAHRDPAAREFLRYLGSELNRLFFMAWGAAETLIGAVVVGLLWNAPGRAIRGVAMAMLVLTAILTFGLTPPIVSVGRALDFVPRDPPPVELATFGLLHMAYSVADLVKLGMGLVLASWVTRAGRGA